MGVLGADVVRIDVTTTSATGSFRDISQQVTDWTGFNFEANLQESHAMGDAWREFLYSNFRMINEITFSGFYDDDTSTGVRGIFFNSTDAGAERVAKLRFGTTNSYIKFDYLIRRAEILPTRGELSRFNIVVQPTGSFSVVTT